MSSILSGLQSFLASPGQKAFVEVTEAKGSTPREAGAWMLVRPDAIFGTIGGGQLEFLSIDKARELIAKNEATGALDIPLGPEIGQCCGGRVALSITLMDETKGAELLERAARQDARRPHVYLFGGGHVGHALAEALELLPLNVSVVETRADALAGLPETVTARLTAVPEEAVREAPEKSAFVVLTHDHALDFLIVAEALKRADAAYVGMIGSKTKRETFRRWYLKEAGGSDEDAARLACPIGGSELIDKRPAVIAALTSAEIMRALGQGSS
ncbi:MAG: xanthine dehydrogenase accessory protein XdhC [Rhizobiaceae bacterium]|nr:xanthine dehydrogenase accessory protein XdhC [Rhizobiaceae bacterium]